MYVHFFLFFVLDSLFLCSILTCIRNVFKYEGCSLISALCFVTRTSELSPESEH